MNIRGCRAFLSPWFERGGMKPADESDTPVYIGRANLGAISLNLIMIYQKAKEENKDFYEVLDYYLEMIRKLHIRTYDYIADMKASINPTGFCEGGFYGGNLGLHDRIEPVIKTWTLSFGITALNELQEIHNHKSLVEDNSFAKEVLTYINKKVDEFKEKDGKLYAIYGTPAESLCGKQIQQFRKKYGIIKGVSDREYVSNSFHCHVTENITGMEKQDKENELYHLCKGGCITYCKYPMGYNHNAIKTLVRRGMKYGMYHGVNLSLSFCNNCGTQYTSKIGDECLVCGSTDITEISRMNGYLSFSKIKGDTRLNDSKMVEIKDRVSM